MFQNKCKLPVPLAYAMLTYIIGSIYYVIVTINVGTPFKDSLNEEQKKVAIKIKDKFNKVYNNKIETNISPIKNYCKAEEYHQKYIEKNRK